MGAVQSKYLLAVRMDVPPEKADELVKWYEEEHIPLILNVPGFRSARLCQGRTPPQDPLPRP